MRVSRGLGFFSLLFSTCFIVFLVLLPLSMLGVRLFQSPEAVTGLWDPVLRSILGVTAQQAVLSSFFSALIGLGVGLWVATLFSPQGAGGKIAQILLALPYGVPTVVAAMTVVWLLGRNGLVSVLGFLEEGGGGAGRRGLPFWFPDWLYSLKAVIFAHVLFNAPWVALGVAQARWRVRRDECEAARTLGASPWNRFCFVLWPSIRPVLLSLSVQVFSLCVMSFALVLLLGGGPPVDTLETAIYSRIRYGSLDLPGALVFAFWEMVLTLLPWGVLLGVEEWRKREGGGSVGGHGAEGWIGVVAETGPTVGNGPSVKTRPAAAWWGWLQAGVVLAACSLFFIPYLSVFAGGVWQGASAILPDVGRAVFLSFEIALSTALLSTVAAVFCLIAGLRFGRLQVLLSLLFTLPASLSVMVLGLGFWLAYSRWIDPFEGSLSAIILLQAAVFCPLVFRALWPLALQAQKTLLEAASTLGASPWRAFWVVEWPRVRAPLLSAMALVAGASLGEVAAVSLFYSENLIPLPLLLSRLLGQYRFEEAQAVAALLFVLSSGSIVLFSGILTKGFPSTRKLGWRGRIARYSAVLCRPGGRKRKATGDEQLPQERQES